MPSTWRYVDVGDASQPEWVILSSKFYGPVEKLFRNEADLSDRRIWRGRGTPDPKALLFYDDLLNGNGDDFHYERVCEIHPWSTPIEFTGPAFIVFRKRVPSVDGA